MDGFGLLFLLQNSNKFTFIDVLIFGSIVFIFALIARAYIK